MTFLAEQLAGNPEVIRAVFEAAGLTVTGHGPKRIVSHGSMNHPDRHPSLSIDLDRGLFHCFGCQEGGDVVSFYARAKGLSFEDTVAEIRERFLDRGKGDPVKPESAVAATYDYVDETGSLLYQVLRLVPKSFRQRRPDGNGVWTWNLNGVRRVLYRLPQLLAADRSQPVWIVEGEKDVDRLVGYGLVATTNAGGAGKWRGEFSHSLVNRHVVVLPDNDELGRRHAEGIVRSVRGVAASVKVADLPGLPPKGDVSDWLDSGHTVEELDQLTEQVQEWTLPSDSGASSEDSSSTLLDQVVSFIRRFVVLTLPQARVVALWVLHTHSVDGADATPYLAVTSPEKQSGKTRLLEVLELLVRNPWFTGRVTSAVLVRKVDEEGPTLLLDESDAAFNGEKEYAETLRGVLNTGHRRGGKASACVGQGATLSYRDFNTFCPKVIAGIGKLPDTVANRSFPIRLRRKASDEKVERLRRRDVEPEAAALTQRLEEWSTYNRDVLTSARPDLPEELSDRAADGAEPLVAIADCVGGQWPQLARASIVELCCAQGGDDDSLGVRLLRDCRTAFEGGIDRISTNQLRSLLADLEESPWGELDHGKPITARRLAGLLKPYGIVSGTIRLSEGTAKGYYRASFEDAFARYLPSPAPEKVTASQIGAVTTTVAAENDQTFASVTVENRTIVNVDTARDVVTDSELGSKGSAAQESRPEIPKAIAPCGYFVGERTTGTCTRCAMTFREHVFPSTDTHDVGLVPGAE